MTEPDAFLQAICEQPWDDTPRLMFADWLTERGDPRGDEIRAAIADPHRGCYTATPAMTWEFRTGAGAEYFPPEDWTLQTRGGFVEVVHLPTAAWLEWGPRLVAKVPLREVRLTDRMPSQSFMESDNRCVYCWWSPGNGPAERHDLPEQLWRIVQPVRFAKKLGAQSTRKVTVKDYPAPEVAVADLSLACIRWARSVWNNDRLKDGLPPLPDLPKRQNRPVIYRHKKDDKCLE